ncbi:MAG: Glycosyl transferase group 1 [Microgenomates bacterium OLB23]|nr:MAG: Glycosyl transferase group 1 [Microgenomates bacterium OLB23]
MRKSQHIACIIYKGRVGTKLVTEAASQGTPSIVYDVDGLRDAVNFGKAGYLTQENNPESLKKIYHFHL